MGRALSRQADRLWQALAGNWRGTHTGQCARITANGRALVLTVAAESPVRVALLKPESTAVLPLLSIPLCALLFLPFLKQACCTLDDDAKRKRFFILTRMHRELFAKVGFQQLVRASAVCTVMKTIVTVCAAAFETALKAKKLHTHSKPVLLKRLADGERVHRESES